MLKERVINALSLRKERRVLIIDKQQVGSAVSVDSLLKEHGFEVVNYENVEAFRLLYEERMKHSDGKIAVIVKEDIYIPYDIRNAFFVVLLALTDIFPKLNPDVLLRYRADWDIISFAYSEVYEDYRTIDFTERFISNSVFSQNTVSCYCEYKLEELRSYCAKVNGYKDWFVIATQKARLEYYAARTDIHIDLTFVDVEFAGFIENGYNRLSQEVNTESPAILTKTFNILAKDRKAKVALIIMDCMSLFDFEIISRVWKNVKYERYETFALIPTMTSVSRQSLLSGKYPRELTKPFSLSDEEHGFYDAGINHGYTREQCEYLRGYDTEISPRTRLLVVVVNDIDDIVHGQRQGKAGMLNDMAHLAKSGRLESLIERLTRQGFTTYITSDHGNTPCIGVGSFRGGVEVETRSKRMVVLKSFAEISSLIAENTVEYGGSYLDKSYHYLICKSGVSFDNKGEQVVTHGGMSIDEVIVPFIRIKEDGSYGK